MSMSRAAILSAKFAAAAGAIFIAALDGNPWED
jgi:hypothetical protein